MTSSSLVTSSSIASTKLMRMSTRRRVWISFRRREEISFSYYISGTTRDRSRGVRHSSVRYVDGRWELKRWVAYGRMDEKYVYVEDDHQAMLMFLRWLIQGLG